jgi:hypothetical protein
MFNTQYAGDKDIMLIPSCFLLLTSNHDFYHVLAFSLSVNAPPAVSIFA